MGMFYPFLNDAHQVQLVGVEAAGEGLNKRHAATLTKGKPGVLHGAMMYLLQDDDGQILPAHSISAGLDYPGVGPEHSYLKDLGIVRYESATDDEAMQALQVLARTEGIICALETAHAVHYAIQTAPNMKRDDTLVVCLSGRGDKDLNTIMKYFQMQ
jgi:tryptophan synthase beta chain